MGDAVGKLYVERHFPPGAKARMDELVANLREAYRVSITDLEWMTPETRARALAKLDKFTPKIGYPAQWRDYSALVDRPRRPVRQLPARVTRSSYDRELAKLGGPVDRDEWFMTPQTVNAYYNPGMNEIVFPAAILQPPFFDAEADDAANYGGIGAVIGHEIGHGFDDQGAKYDGDGNLVDWWTDGDRTEFGTRTDGIDRPVRRLRAASAGATHHVNGAFTIGENIGDLGGLSIALLAYELSLGGTRGAGDRRPDRRAAGVLRLGAGVAHQVSRRRGDPAAGHRSALAAGVPVQRRDPQHRRVLRRVRGQRRPTDCTWSPQQRVRIWN